MSMTSRATENATHSAQVAALQRHAIDVKPVTDWRYMLTYRRLNARFLPATLSRHEARLMDAVRTRHEASAARLDAASDPQRLDAHADGVLADGAPE